MSILARGRRHWRRYWGEWTALASGLAAAVTAHRYVVAFPVLPAIVGAVTGAVVSAGYRWWRRSDVPRPVGRHPPGGCAAVSGLASPGVSSPARTVAGMTETRDQAGAWDCPAYGPEGRQHGALCFASPELGERECRTEGECAALLAGERSRVFDAIGGMAAAGDPTGKYLAARITRPGQLLGGGEPTDHEFVPGGEDSTFGEAGTWCAVWLDGGGESDQCGMPRDAHWAAGEGRADG